MKLLLVEDDDLLAESLAETLQDECYSSDIATRIGEAEALMATEEYALAIVDLGLPDGSGLGAIERWRSNGQRLPILILTARDTWDDKVIGLNCGADDYVTKPYHESELLARLHALLRRHTGGLTQILSVNGVALNEASKEVSIDDGAWVTLTATEYRLLRFLMRHPDHVHSKLRLLDQLYSLEQDAPTPNLVEVYIGRLRRLLGKQRIQTRRGQGYVFPSR